MKIISAFLGLSVFIVAMTVGATPLPTDGMSSNENLSDDMTPADMYLRLSNLRCENCTLIVRDLMETGAVDNTIGAVNRVLNSDLNYTFRLNLLTTCNDCYRAMHFWEMNILNRAATNEEIFRWLESEESKPLVEYFSR